jgi:hypothetical protein
MRFDIDHSFEVLSRTPPVMRAMLGGVGDGWTRENEGADTFSPFDVIGHLIDGEETDWIPRARIVMSQGENRTFERYDRFRHKSRNKDRSLESLLDEFEKLRGENIALVKSWKLTSDDLRLTATHPALGSVTLAQLLAAWVVHDLGHIAQVSRVMAKQYKEEVGPWIQYLPVLTDHEKPRS